MLFGGVLNGFRESMERLPTLLWGTSIGARIFQSAATRKLGSESGHCRRSRKINLAADKNVRAPGQPRILDRHDRILQSRVEPVPAGFFKTLKASLIPARGRAQGRPGCRNQQHPGALKARFIVRTVHYSTRRFFSIPNTTNPVRCPLARSPSGHNGFEFTTRETVPRRQVADTRSSYMVC
jgi:hypothetical protein